MTCDLTSHIVTVVIQNESFSLLMLLMHCCHLGLLCHCAPTGTSAPVENSSFQLSPSSEDWAPDSSRNQQVCGNKLGTDEHTLQETFLH